MCVSVITPFYNTREYLSECIESVLSQTYSDFEYILQDNHSTDGSDEIARHFAQRDPRIRLTSTPAHVGQVENYNLALRQIAPASVYCKIVQADDWIFPACLQEMVNLAQTSDEIRIVTSFRLKGNAVLTGGPDPLRTVQSGTEVCRLYLIDGIDQFGSPTTVMYRADVVRSRSPFYPLGNDFEDLDVCLDILRGGKLGFVPQILSFSRTQEGAIRRKLERLDVDALKRIVLHHRYGADFLSAKEFIGNSRKVASNYWRMMGQAALTGRSREYWHYQRQGLEAAGLRFSRTRLAMNALRALASYATCPRTVLSAGIEYVRSGRKRQ